MSAQTARATPEQLATLTPLAGLSPERLAELAQVAVVERAARGSDPLQERMKAAQSVFLLQGELLLAYEGGGTLVVVGGSEETRQALNRQKPRIGRSKAITDVDLLSVDDDVLDILVVLFENTFDALPKIVLPVQCGRDDGKFHRRAPQEEDPAARLRSATLVAALVILAATFASLRGRAPSEPTPPSFAAALTLGEYFRAKKTWI